MSSKLEPVIWLRDTGHIGIHGGADGRMGYDIFLAMVLRYYQKNVCKRHFYPQSLFPCYSIKCICKCCSDLRFLLLLTTILIVHDKRLLEVFLFS